MRVHVCQQTCQLRPSVRSPATCVAKEKPLFGSESVHSLTRLALHGLLVSRISYDQASQIGDGFANYKLTVLVDSLFDLKPIELIDDTLCPRLKCFQVSISPPISEISCRVKLPTLIVETMRHFVANNRAHATIVEGVVCLGIEKRWLQDSSGKHYLVNLRIVVGIDGWRRHTPFHSVYRPPNLVQVAPFLKSIRPRSVT